MVQRSSRTRRHARKKSPRRNVQPWPWKREIAVPRRRLLIDRLEDRHLLSADLGVELEILASKTPFEANELSDLNLTSFRIGEADLPVFEGEWIVQFARDTESGSIAKSVTAVETLLRDHLDGVVSVQNLASTETFLVRTSSDLAHEGIVSALTDIEGFLTVEPNFLAWMDDTIPNDSLFGVQWALENTGQLGGVVDADIDAPLAWDINTGSGGTVVGVVDSGVYYNHADLNDNMWRNPGEIAGDGIDNDGNGFIDDIFGYDFLNGDNDPFDDEGHGTAVAGIIAAEGNNAQGVVGVNWDAKIMALKIFDPVGFAGTAQIVGAVNYATMMKRDYGVDVIATNHSWGTVGFSTVLRDAIAASGDQEILFVASAGNSNHDNDIAPQYPASYDLDNIISVAATDRFDAKAGFSSFGATTVDLGAPGVSTQTTSRFGGFTSFGGTSAAAPYVAGAAALVHDTFPGASALEVKQALLDGTDPISALAGITVTGGRLNLFGAMQAMQMQITSATPDDGDLVSSPPTDFTIATAFAIDPATIDASDLTVNGGPADNVTVVNPTTLTFSFTSSPVTAEGGQEVRVAEAAFTRLSDSGPVKEFIATFRFDTLPLEAVATTPAAGTIVPLPFTSIEIDFNEDVDPASVDIGDLALSEGSVTGFTVIDSDTIAYDIAGITSDRQLIVQIPKGVVADAFGNPNLPFTTTLDVDVDTRQAADFERMEPLGGLIFSSYSAGRLSSAGDVDRFEFFIEAGQRVAVQVTPLDASATVTAELIGLAGPAASSVPGQPVMLPPTAVDTDGTVTLEISGDLVTDYHVKIVRNAAIEDPNSGSPQNITESAITVGSRRFGVLGSIDTVGQVDRFTVDLSVSLGRPVDLLLSGQDGVSFSSATLELIAPDGTIVTAGPDPLNSSASNFDLAILGFVPNQIGDYTLRVTSLDTGQYGIVVTERLLFEAEVNDGPLGVFRTVDLVGSAAGFISDLDSTGLFEFTVDTSQSSLTISGGLGDLSGTILIPVQEQAPGSLESDLTGTIQAVVSSDSIELLPEASVFPFEKPGLFQPGNAPADYAGELIFPVGAVIAFRDSAFGAAAKTVSLDPSGDFAADELSFLLSTTFAVSLPGVVIDTFEFDVSFVDNVASAPGTLQLVGGLLELTVPIETRLLLPVPDFPFAGIIDMSGAIVATAIVPGPDDVYEITLGTGQTISVATQTPFDDPASTPGNPLDPAIEIQDASGAPLDFDDNSASDGRNAQISFTAPTAGVYRIAVQHVSGAGEYVMSIDGHTGSAPGPLEVIAVDPVDGALLSGDVSELVVDFSDLLDGATIDASDLTVDAVAATSVETIDANTLRFSFATAFGEGEHTVEMADGVLTSTDGVLLTGLTSSFRVDKSGPRVVSTSIQEGNILAAGDLSILIGFDETIVASNLDASDFEIRSRTSGATFTADAFLYNPVGSTLSIHYSSLPEDLYTLTLRSGDGAFEDLLGNDLDGEPLVFTIPPNVSGDGVTGGDFFVNFDLDHVTGPFPTPLEPKLPAGSLIYDPLASGLINSPIDTDSFTLELDSIQTLSVLVESDQSLQSTVQVFDPDGVSLGSAQASSAGGPAFLQTLSVNKAGTYTITVGGAGGTTGSYTVQSILNAALEDEELDGPANDTLASAQDINGAFIGLSDQQLTLTAPTQFNNLFFPNVVTVDFTGVPFPIGDAELTIDAITDLGDSSEFLTIEAEGIDLGRVFEFDGSEGGRSLTTITISETDIQTLAADGIITFNVTPSAQVNDFTSEELTLSLTIGQPASSRAAVLGTGDGIASDMIMTEFIVDPSQSFVTIDVVEIPITPQPGSSLTTSYDGTLQIERGSGTLRIVGAALNAQDQPGAFAPLGLSADYAAIAELIPGALSGPVTIRDAIFDLVSPSLIVDALGNFATEEIALAISSGLIDIEFPPIVPVGTFDISGSDRALNEATAPGTLIELADGSFEIVIPALFSAELQEPTTGLVVTMTITAQFVAHAAAPDPTDLYRFDLEAGESTTIVAEGLSGSVAQLELLDGAGNLLADGVESENADQRIANFVTSGAGTFFVRVTTGGPDTDYSLVVTKNADFETEGTLGEPQNLSPSGNVLGNAGSLGVSDPSNGVPSPSFINLVDGEGFNWDITSNGSITNGTFDAFDGGIINIGFPGQLSGLLEDDGREQVLGPATVSGVEMTRKVFVPEDAGFARFLEIVTNSSPTTQSFTVDIFTNLGSDSSTSVIGTSDGDLNFTTADNWIVTDDFDFGGDPTVAHVIAGDGAQRPSTVNQSFDNVSYSYNLTLEPGETQIIMHFAAQNPDQATALAKAGAIDNFELDVFAGMSQSEAAAVVNFNLETADSYSVDINTGDVVRIATRTPADGPGEFVNDFVPAIKVFDSSGTLVLTDTQSAGDGRNVDVSFTAQTSGTYIVHVAAASGEPGGEYLLLVEGNTGDPPPLVVTDTSPTDGAIVQSAPTYTVDFSSPLLLTSVDASDLEVDGVTASSVTIIDGDTLAFTLPALSDATYTIAFAEGAITSLSGQDLEAFSAELTVDTAPPQVAFSSVQTGDVLPSGNFVYTATFNEAIAPPDAGDFRLLGSSFPFPIAPDSFDYDPSSLTLTVEYSGLPADDYSMTLVSGSIGLQDLAGNTLDGNGDGVAEDDFVVDFSLVPLTVAVENLVITTAGAGLINGSFEVFFQAPSDLSNTLAAYNLSLNVTSQSGDVGTFLVFSASEPMTHPPVFPGIDPSEFATGLSLQAAANLPSGDAAIPAGSGIIKVNFLAQAAVEDVFDITINLDETGFFNGQGNEITIDNFQDGSVELVIDAVAPVVEEVLLSSTQWSPAFLDYLASEGMGTDGFAIQTGSGVQLTPLPWVNLDQVKIRFSEDVDVEQADLTLRGIEFFAYSFSDFSYDETTFTGTWTVHPAFLDPTSGGLAGDRFQIVLDDAVADQVGNALDGDFENPTDISDPTSDVLPSGDGDMEGDFLFRFDTLAGDVNGSGSVFGDDVIEVRNNQFSFPGLPSYTAFRDVNGSGSIFGDDVLLVRNRQFRFLPVASPSSLALAPGADRLTESFVDLALEDFEVESSSVRSQPRISLAFATAVTRDRSSSDIDSENLESKPTPEDQALLELDLELG